MAATVALAPAARPATVGTAALGGQAFRAAHRLLVAKAARVETAAAPAMAVTVEPVALQRQLWVPAAVAKAALAATAALEATAVMAAVVGSQFR